MPSFYNGKRFFLTYPQCDFSPGLLHVFLEAQAPIRRYVIARELHEDGSPHLHACVEFQSLQRHDCRWLDFNGHHPNKQDPRNWNACITYVKKDGEFIEGPERLENVERKPIEECESFELKVDWMQYCVQKKYSYQYAEYFWNALHGNKDTIDMEDVVEGVMCAELRQFQIDLDRHKCLIIKGRSGCGKTVWAKTNAPRPALFCSHIDQLKAFDPSRHKSIIFDDVDFKHYPRVSQIHLCDFDNARAIHCRHSVAFIPAGIFKIFTCNELPVDIADAAIRRRCVVVNL